MIEVILLERIERLGLMGQVVKVRPGFARNFLLPQNKALRATKANLEQFEKQRAILEAKNASDRSKAEAVATKIDSLKRAKWANFLDPSTPVTSPMPCTKLDTRLSARRCKLILRSKFWGYFLSK